MRTSEPSLISRRANALARDGVRTQGYPVNPQPYVRQSVVSEYRPSWLSERDWHENSLMVLNLRELQQRIELRNQIEQDWQSWSSQQPPQVQQRQWQPQPQSHQQYWQHQPQQAYWQQPQQPQQWQPQQRQQPQRLQPQHPPIAPVGYFQSPTSAHSAARAMPVGQIRQLSIRSEPDVVHFVSGLLGISTSDPRMSVNFDEHAEGYPQDSRTLSIELTNASEVSRAYASLANLNQPITLRNGERARLHTRIGPLFPDHFGRVDIYVIRDNDLPGKLTVSMINKNSPTRGNPSSFRPA